MAKLMTLPHKALVEEAIRAMRNAYGVPHDAPRYGAAVLTDKGNIYASGQYRAETRQISLHAEQAALVHAAAHGEGTVRAIAMVSNEDRTGNSFTNPCGICKQALYEHALTTRTEIEVVLAKPSGEYRRIPLAELVPYPWPASSNSNPPASKRERNKARLTA